MNALGRGYRVGHMWLGAEEHTYRDPVCPGCRETFIRRGPDDDRVYCTAACTPKRGRRRLPEEPMVRTVVGRMGEATCAGCGTTFPRPTVGRGKDRQYCTERCRKRAAVRRYRERLEDVA